ncbi:MAG: helix-turn-helix transcriptional regulator [Clostridia bacterium]|nr:helix-turn-helix transcriptional regulator [Clostridia bacterium]
MDEVLIKQAIAENLVYYRRKNGLTQLELAEKLNYSDKSVSKWERAEGMPDFLTMCRIAELYGIGVDDLINTETSKRQPSWVINHTVLSWLITVGIWLIATLVFSLLSWLAPDLSRTWLCFIYAIPASSIVHIVFGSIGSKKWQLCIYISILVWGLLLSVYLSLLEKSPATLFIVGCPAQVIIVLAMFLRRPVFKKLKDIGFNKRNIKSNEVTDENPDEQK